ncbi:VTT domain-containing protein [Paraglaciecola sp. 20A4]|uniref:TVP38/TMEM64 family protein n=1 Tax=Paraglaciecola sp. 20A4 TaxID=2687288 RepID=UPI00140E349B|nr:VTT domain-containing protein [Paraglaciecola sp. 20A4]
MYQKIRALFCSKALQKGLLFLLVCAVLGGLISTLPLFDAFNRHWVDSTIRNNGILGMGYFLLFSAGTMAIGCPRQVMAFLGGYAFGFAQGVALSVAAAVIGCLLSFFVARVFLRPLIKRRYAPRIHRVNDFLKDKPITKTVVIRLLPVGNNLLTNLLAGVTDVKARYFLIGSGIGYVPQMAVFALMGKGIVVLSFWKILLSVVLFGVSSALSVSLYKQYKNSKIVEATAKPQADGLMCD